jgi:hypothetical protein
VAMYDHWRAKRRAEAVVVTQSDDGTDSEERDNGREKAGVASPTASPTVPQMVVSPPSPSSSTACPPPPVVARLSPPADAPTSIVTDGDKELIGMMRLSRRSLETARRSRGSGVPFRYLEDPSVPESEPLAGMWPGAADLDLLRMRANVTMTLTGRNPQFPFGPGRWAGVPDLGLKCYATITIVNTGDVFEVGKGAYGEIRWRFLKPIGKLQAQMSQLVNQRSEVVTAKKALDKAMEACHGPTNHEELLSRVATSLEEYRETITTVTIRLQSDHNSGYPTLQAKCRVLREAHLQYRTALAKTTSKLLASLGPGGMILFATNLLDKKAKSSRLDNGGINAMGFGALRRQVVFDCGRTGCQLRYVREDRSSSWCTYCGRYNGNLGASRTFKCGNAKCLKQYSRDAGSGRGITQVELMDRAKHYLPRVLGGLPQPAVTEVRLVHCLRGE